MEKIQEQVEVKLEQDAAALEALNLRLSWVGRRWLQHDLDAHHLTVPQYMTLRCIQDSTEGCSMSELAESSHQVSATMTGIVDRLADRGLVARTPHPRDRRTLRVVLTPAGQQLMAEIHAAKRTLTRQVLSSLLVEERQAMIQTTRRYLEMMESILCSP